MTTPHDKALSAAMAAFNQVVNEPQMIKCDRCDGKGYHHGFGENGVDPDWCDKCGGGGYDVAPGEESRALNAAISTYLSSIGGIVCAREPAAWQYAVDDVAFDVTTDKAKAAHLATMVPVIPLHTPIEAGNGGDGWLDIATAPKDGTNILVAAYYDDKPTVGCAYWPESDEWFWWHDQEYSLSENGFEARFWRPLPLPPSPSNEGEKRS